MFACNSKVLWANYCERLVNSIKPDATSKPGWYSASFYSIFISTVETLNSVDLEERGRRPKQRRDGSDTERADDEGWASTTCIMLGLLYLRQRSSYSMKTVMYCIKNRTKFFPIIWKKNIHIRFIKGWKGSSEGILLKRRWLDGLSEGQWKRCSDFSSQKNRVVSKII